MDARSRARLRSAATIHVADPALAVTVLGGEPTRLAATPQTAGFLFKSAVVHDLLVLTEALGGTVHHDRDSSRHEIDAVLPVPDGPWVVVEVKLGASQIQAGAQSLKRTVEQIDPASAGEPAFRLVVTGTGHAPGDEPVDLTVDNGSLLTLEVSYECTAAARHSFMLVERSAVSPSSWSRSRGLRARWTAATSSA